jgi:AmmeMemoRadiSam system protein B
MDANVRPSPIAGLWYEGEPQALARSVDSYMDAARLPALDGDVVAVVAPHAGHRFSGPVAGYAFAALRGLQPDVVAVLSPFHNFHSAALLTTSHAAYGTPLGAVPVDGPLMEALNAALNSRLGFGLAPLANDPEHSLEIELPFLQRAFTSEWTLLPLMVRAHEAHICKAVGQILAQVLAGRNVILVASTDLSHYYEQRVALAMDRALLEPVEAFDPDRIFDVERSGRGYACGAGALATVMWAARAMGADHAELLHHATSGDVTGDYANVVGYAAAVFIKRH